MVTVTCNIALHNRHTHLPSNFISSYSSFSLTPPVTPSSNAPTLSALGCCLCLQLSSCRFPCSLHLQFFHIFAQITFSVRSFSLPFLPWHYHSISSLALPSALPILLFCFIFLHHTYGLLKTMKHTHIFLTVSCFLTAMLAE